MPIICCCPDPTPDELFYYTIVRCDGSIDDNTGMTSDSASEFTGPFGYGGHCYLRLKFNGHIRPATLITHIDVTDSSTCADCLNQYYFIVGCDGTFDPDSPGLIGTRGLSFTGPFKYGDTCYKGIAGPVDLIPEFIITHDMVTDIISCDECNPTQYYFFTPCIGGSSTVGIRADKISQIPSFFKYGGVCYSGVTGPTDTVPVTVVSSVTEELSCEACLINNYIIIPCDGSAPPLINITAANATAFTGPFIYASHCYAGIAGPIHGITGSFITHSDVTTISGCDDPACSGYYWAVPCAGGSTTIAVLPANYFSGAFKYGGVCYSGLSGPTVGSPSIVITSGDIDSKANCTVCNGYYYVVPCGGSPDSSIGMTTINSAAFTSGFKYGATCYSGVDGPHATAPGTLITISDVDASSDYDTCEKCIGWAQVRDCNGTLQDIGVIPSDVGGMPGVFIFGSGCYTVSIDDLVHTMPSTVISPSDVSDGVDCPTCTGGGGGIVTIIPCSDANFCILVEIFNSGGVLSGAWIDFELSPCTWNDGGGATGVACDGFNFILTTFGPSGLGSLTFTAPAGGCDSGLPIGTYSGPDGMYAVISVVDCP